MQQLIDLIEGWRYIAFAAPEAELIQVNVVYGRLASELAEVVYATGTSEGDHSD